MKIAGGIALPPTLCGDGYDFLGVFPPTSSKPGRDPRQQISNRPGRLGPAQARAGQLAVPQARLASTSSA
jgi:hypothetical protein